MSRVASRLLHLRNPVAVVALPQRAAPRPAHSEIFAQLTTLQAIAMLGMIHTGLTTGIIKRITRIEDVQDKPSWSDFVALREFELCAKNAGARYHTLTAHGRDFGDYLIAKLCQRYAIHTMREIQHQGAMVYRCSCGLWSMQAQRGGMHQWRRAHNSWSAHVPPASFAAEAV